VGEINFADASNAEFKTPQGDTLATPHALGKAAFQHLRNSWPAAVGFADLAAAAQRLLPPTGGTPHTASDDDIERVGGILLQAACSGLIQLHRYPPRLTATISERPLASLVARRQAEAKAPITNLLQRTIVLGDELSRQFLMLVDGTRDVDGLVTDLRESLSRSGSAESSPVTRASVEHELRMLADLALLI
jgi:hypothetical protein